MPLTCRCVPRSEWNSIARSLPDFNYSLTAEYGEIMKSLHHSRILRLLACDGNESIAALQAEIRKGLVGWRAQIGYSARPSRGPGLSVLASPYSEVASAMLLHELERRAPGRLELIELYSSYSLECFERLGYIHRRNENMLVMLDSSSQILWGRLTQSRRHGVRFAYRSGVKISKANGLDDFLNFYSLYLMTAKRVGFRPAERQHLQRMVKQLEDSEHPSSLLLARYRGRAVAAGLLICCRSGWATWDIGCSDPEFWRLRPNDALIWEMIKLSHEAGSVLLNLGDGNYGFKRQFGGTPVSINRYTKTVFPAVIQSAYGLLNTHPLAKYALFIASDSLPSFRRSIARILPQIGET
jgi:hypothetical protein